MNNEQYSAIVSFLWGIADDVLRDVYVRGKYRDVILPMIVLRRLDAVLEPTAQTVRDMAQRLDDAGVAQQDQALRQAAGQAFYNTSKFTMRDLKSRVSQQQLKQDFEAYLDGFSPNVQEILDNFEFRNQLNRLSKADALGPLIEKMLSPTINLSPHPIKDAGGAVRLPGLDNHAMGTVFEDLVRRFNEENNEEAGEHWTPRDVVRLMSRLMFEPVADQVQSGTYLLYDAACGTGGMLTVADQTLRELTESQGKSVETHLYGQEINSETYAICKADLLLKGEGEEADNIVGGPEHSTISNDAFPTRTFDFMLANPPYGKSWKTDLDRMGGKKDLQDHRFIVKHGDDPALPLIPRSSDGQMLFLANMVSKMKHDTPLGSRIAEVHNGSSLFTGDAGQGESNIRRWIIENDWLEAIVALPLNLFYNTGIATYIWVLSNRKAEERKGKVQLIDATSWSKPLRKNLGKKNCEVSDADLERILSAFHKFEETPQSKIFDNRDFGYWKVKVERPLRLRAQFSTERINTLRFASGDTDIRADLLDEIGDELFSDFASVKPQVQNLLKQWSTAADDDTPPRYSVSAKSKKKLLDSATWERDSKLVHAARQLHIALGDEESSDFNDFRSIVAANLKQKKLQLSAAETKLILKAVSWPSNDAEPVVKKRHKKGKAEADHLRGLFATSADSDVIEYEPDPDLRDYEQVPLNEDGGIEAFIRREVLPHAEDAWIVETDTKIGYEISFTRHFYKPPKLRSLEEISADILALEQESEALLSEITGGTAR